jgi:hypothetical protein
MGIDSVLPDFRGPGGFWKVRALGPTGLLDSGHSLCISERRLSGKLLVGTVPLAVRREKWKRPFESPLVDTLLPGKKTGFRTLPVSPHSPCLQPRH